MLTVACSIGLTAGCASPQQVTTPPLVPLSTTDYERFLAKIAVPDQAPPSSSEATPSASNDDALRRYVAARDLVLQGRLSEAADAYRGVVSMDPGSVEAWHGLATCEGLLGRGGPALEAYRRVLILRPDDPDALLEVGLDEARRGTPREAIYLLARRRLAPLRLGGNLLADIAQAAALASSLEILGRDAAAARARLELRRAILAASDPATPEVPTPMAWRTLTRHLKGIDELGTARDALLARLMAGGVVQAADDRLQALAIATDAAAGSDGISIEAMLEHRSAGPVPFASLYDAAQIYAFLGNATGAMQLYEAALLRDPEHAMVLNNLAYLALESLEVDDRIVSMIESAWRLSPEDPNILDTVGWLRYLQGRFKDDEAGPGAVSLIRTALERFTQPHPVVLEHLGDAAWRAGDESTARSAWQFASLLIGDPEWRTVQVTTNGMVQLQGWGVLVVDPVHLYDREHGDTARRIGGKIDALRSGVTPTPSLTLAEHRAARRQGREPR